MLVVEVHYDLINAGNDKHAVEYVPSPVFVAEEAPPVVNELQDEFQSVEQDEAVANIPEGVRHDHLIAPHMFDLPSNRLVGSVAHSDGIARNHACADQIKGRPVEEALQARVRRRVGDLSGGFRLSTRGAEEILSHLACHVPCTFTLVFKQLVSEGFTRLKLHLARKHAIEPVRCSRFLGATMHAVHRFRRMGPLLGQLLATRKDLLEALVCLLQVLLHHCSGLVTQSVETLESHHCATLVL
mmetsp:Transcript_86802/g.201991  ORF Transcript_86802/g.201991 Transcript_86802/m.201991 type:complete len:242 (+) Transcript_86802:1092-1817(+)